MDFNYLSFARFSITIFCKEHAPISRCRGSCHEGIAHRQRSGVRGQRSDVEVVELRFNGGISQMKWYVAIGWTSQLESVLPSDF